MMDNTNNIFEEFINKHPKFNSIPIIYEKAKENIVSNEVISTKTMIEIHYPEIVYRALSLENQKDNYSFEEILFQLYIFCEHMISNYKITSKELCNKIKEFIPSGNQDNNELYRYLIINKLVHTIIDENTIKDIVSSIKNSDYEFYNNIANLLGNIYKDNFSLLNFYFDDKDELNYVVWYIYSLIEVCDIESVQYVFFNFCTDPNKKFYSIIVKYTHEKDQTVATEADAIIYYIAKQLEELSKQYKNFIDNYKLQ